MKSNNTGDEDRQWSLGQTFAALVGFIPAFAIADHWRVWFQARCTNSIEKVKNHRPDEAQNKDPVYD